MRTAKCTNVCLNIKQLSWTCASRRPLDSTIQVQFNDDLLCNGWDYMQTVHWDLWMRNWCLLLQTSVKLNRCCPARAFTVNPRHQWQTFETTTCLHMRTATGQALHDLGQTKRWVLQAEQSAARNKDRTWAWCILIEDPLVYDFLHKCVGFPATWIHWVPPEMSLSLNAYEPWTMLQTIATRCRMTWSGDASTSTLHYKSAISLKWQCIVYYLAALFR